jgi:Spy/CpxP family protein refolding chaperone
MMTGGRTQLKIWLVVVGVFVLGCVTGASVSSVYRLQASNDERQDARGRRGKEDLFESMKRDLSLNDHQATEVRAILDQTRNDYRALRAEVRPRYDAIRQKARARIKALLTPEQQQIFDTKAAERDARRDKEEKNER